MPKQASIDLGMLQKSLTNARSVHAANSKALIRAQEAHARSKKVLDDTHAAMDSAARNVLANG